MTKYYKQIALVLGLALTAGVTGCYKEDPIKEKERQQEKPDTPKEPEAPKEELTTYSFEHWATVPKKKYTVPLLTEEEDPKTSFWVSASNEGYDFATMFGSPIKGYPVEATEQGYKGKGVWLRTLDADLAVVTGALYSGKVNARSLTNPTLFGQPCELEPLELSFYYKYKAGAGKVKGFEDGKDRGSVQGVLYDITDKDAYLDGKTIKNDERIVSRAYILVEDTKEDEWVQQTVKFAPVSEAAAKTIDFKTRKYRLSLIFSSSANGDSFDAADKSEMFIDEVTLKSKPNN